MLPRGLYGRSLLIIILPMVLLQAVVAVVFMDRHYDLVTRRLSDALTNTIAGLVEVYQIYPQDKDFKNLIKLAGQKFNLNISILSNETLPVKKKSFLFTSVDQNIESQLKSKLKHFFWINTKGEDVLDIRILLNDGKIMRVLANRKQAVPSNTHIFIVWMVSTALVLLCAAILFLHNQIRPILDLARAVEAFGMGQTVDAFRPRGADEVRRAAYAFIEMRKRIERQMEQRTTMLAAVSHDLGTVLTRFRLALALLPADTDITALEDDVHEMEKMLKAYLAFAKNDTAEEIARPLDLKALLYHIAEKGRRSGLQVTLKDCAELPFFQGKPIALARCLDNIVHNASRFADQLVISLQKNEASLHIIFDDDGPGIPFERHEDVFKPFHRLDDARNQNMTGSGLGLTIVKDIARSHGGEVTLSSSPWGGLRVILQLPFPLQPNKGTTPFNS